MAIIQELNSSATIIKEVSVNNGTTSNRIIPADTVKKLYKHVCAAECCETRYSEHTNVKDEKNALTARIASESIIHRHKLHDGDWVTISFTLQGEDVKKIAAKALENYQDLDPDCEGWTFQPPYMPIVHRWDRLKELQAEATEDNGKQAADGLMDFLSPLLASSIDSLAKTKATKKVSFSGIWQIFPPGELVLTKFYGIETVCRITKYKRVATECFDGWSISYEYVEWNGQSCGYATSKAMIPNFSGTVRVTDLPVYPLSFDDDAGVIQSRLTERGREFERLRGYHFLTYSGKKILLTKPEAKPVSGRVVIDAFAYYRSCNIVKPELKPLYEEVKIQDEKQKDEDTSTPDTEDVREDSDSDDGDDDDDVSVAAGPAFTTLATNEPVARKEDLRALTDEQCLLATPWLIGLDLKTKEWGQFLIGDLAEITWTDTAFDNLVLPGGEKELAWSFVENKNLSNGEWDDFIPEKGRGIIILMFGPPGVGKTYTAEAVAEKSRSPLYSITAGVLGTKPKEVEDALDHALELCKLWNAMLLLDEADIFLGARTNEGLARNELVSIFLTKLEYYQGILFLTTNRFSSIDYAFQSRIDLFLPYSDLTPPARKEVWENFINRTPEKFDIADDGIRKLSEINLNGREIKNLIKSAQLLCFKSGDKVNAERLCILAENRVKALKLLKESDDYV